MNEDRRKFIKRSTLGAIAGLSSLAVKGSQINEKSFERQEEELDKILAEPVLRINELKEPVWIEKIELLRREDNFICRVLSKSGAEGLSVSNNMQMKNLYPIFINRI
jgi:hypothetical protein